MTADDLNSLIEDVAEKLGQIDDACQTALLADLGIDTDQWAQILTWMADLEAPGDMDLFSYFIILWNDFATSDEIQGIDERAKAAHGLVGRAIPLLLQSENPNLYNLLALLGMIEYPDGSQCPQITRQRLWEFMTTMKQSAAGIEPSHLLNQLEEELLQRLSGLDLDHFGEVLRKEVVGAGLKFMFTGDDGSTGELTISRDDQKLTFRPQGKVNGATVTASGLKIDMKLNEGVTSFSYSSESGVTVEPATIQPQELAFSLEVRPDGDNAFEWGAFIEAAKPQLKIDIAEEVLQLHLHTGKGSVNLGKSSLEWTEANFEADLKRQHTILAVDDLILKAVSPGDSSALTLLQLDLQLAFHGGSIVNGSNDSFANFVQPDIGKVPLNHIEALFGQGVDRIRYTFDVPARMVPDNLEVTLDADAEATLDVAFGPEWDLFATVSASLKEATISLGSPLVLLHLTPANPIQLSALAEGNGFAIDLIGAQQLGGSLEFDIFSSLEGAPNVLINNVWGGQTDSFLLKWNFTIDIPAVKGAGPERRAGHVIDQWMITWDGAYPSLGRDLLQDVVVQLGDLTVNQARQLLSLAGEVPLAGDAMKVTFGPDGNATITEDGALLIPLGMTVAFQDKVLLEGKGKFRFKLPDVDGNGRMFMQPGAFQYDGLEDGSLAVEKQGGHSVELHDLLRIHIPQGANFQFSGDPTDPTLSWEKPRGEKAQGIMLNVPANGESKFGFEMAHFKIHPAGIDMRGTVLAETVNMGTNAGFDGDVVVLPAKPSATPSPNGDRPHEIGEIEFNNSKLVYGSLQATSRLPYFDDAVGTLTLFLSQNGGSELVCAGTLDISGIDAFHLAELYTTVEIDNFNLGVVWNGSWESSAQMTGRVVFQPPPGESSGSMGILSTLFEDISLAFEDLDPLNIEGTKWRLETTPRYFDIGSVLNVGLRGLEVSFVADANSYIPYRLKDFKLLGDISIQELPGVDSSLTFGGITLEPGTPPTFDIDYIAAEFTVPGGFGMKGGFLQIRDESEFGFGGEFVLKAEGLPELTGMIKLTRIKALDGSFVPSIAVFVERSFDTKDPVQLVYGFYLRRLGVGLGLRQALRGLESKDEPMQVRLERFVDNPAGLPNPKHVTSWRPVPNIRNQGDFSWMLVGAGMITWLILDEDKPHVITSNILLSIDQDLEIVLGANLWLFASPREVETPEFLARPVARGAMMFSPSEGALSAYAITLEDPMLGNQAPPMLREILSMVRTSLRLQIDGNGFLTEIGWPLETEVDYSIGGIFDAKVRAGFRYGLYRGAMIMGLNLAVVVELRYEYGTGFSAMGVSAHARLLVEGRAALDVSLVGAIDNDFNSYVLGNLKLNALVTVTAEASWSISIKVFGKKIGKSFSFRASVSIALSASLTAAMNQNMQFGFTGEAAVAISVCGYRIAGRVAVEYAADIIDEVRTKLESLMPPAIGASTRAARGAVDAGLGDGVASPLWQYRFCWLPVPEDGDGQNKRLRVVLFPAPGQPYPKPGEATDGRFRLTFAGDDARTAWRGFVGSPLEGNVDGNTLAWSEDLDQVIFSYKKQEIRTGLEEGRDSLTKALGDEFAGLHEIAKDYSFEMLENVKELMIVKGQLSSLEPLVKNAGDELASLEGEIKSITEELEAAQTKLNEKTVQLEEAQNELDLLRGTPGVVQYMIDEAKRRRDEAAEEKTELEERVSALETRESDYKIQKAEIETRKDDLETEKSESVARRDVLRILISEDLDENPEADLSQFENALAVLPRQETFLQWELELRLVQDELTRYPASMDDEKEEYSLADLLRTRLAGDSKSQLEGNEVVSGQDPEYEPKLGKAYTSVEEEDSGDIPPGMLFSELLRLLKDEKAVPGEPIADEDQDEAYKVAPYMRLVLEFEGDLSLFESDSGDPVPNLIDLKEGLLLNGVIQARLEPVIKDTGAIEYDLIPGVPDQNEAQINLAWEFRRETPAEDGEDPFRAYDELEHYIVTRTNLSRPNDAPLISIVQPAWIVGWEPEPDEAGGSYTSDLIRPRYQFVDRQLEDVREGDYLQYRIEALALDRPLSSTVIGVVRRTEKPVQPVADALALQVVQFVPEDDDQEPSEASYVQFYVALDTPVDKSVEDRAPLSEKVLPNHYDDSEFRLRYRLVSAATVGSYGFDLRPPTPAVQVEGLPDRKGDPSMPEVRFAEPASRESIPWDETLPLKELTFDWINPSLVEEGTPRLLVEKRYDQDAGRDQEYYVGLYYRLKWSELEELVKDTDDSSAIEFYIGRKRYETRKGRPQPVEQSPLVRMRHAVMPFAKNNSEDETGNAGAVAVAQRKDGGIDFGRGNPVDAFEALFAPPASREYVSPNRIGTEVYYDPGEKVGDEIVREKPRITVRWRHDRSISRNDGSGEEHNPVVGYRLYCFDRYDPAEYPLPDIGERLRQRPLVAARAIPERIYRAQPKSINVVAIPRFSKADSGKDVAAKQAATPESYDGNWQPDEMREYGPAPDEAFSPLEMNNEGHDRLIWEGGLLEDLEIRDELLDFLGHVAGEQGWECQLSLNYPKIKDRGAADKLNRPSYDDALKEATDVYGWWTTESQGLSAEFRFLEDARPVKAERVWEQLQDQLEKSGGPSGVVICFFKAADGVTLLDVMRIIMLPGSDDTLTITWPSVEVAAEKGTAALEERLQERSLLDEDKFKLVVFSKVLPARQANEENGNEGQGRAADPIATVDLPISDEGIVEYTFQTPDEWAHEYELAIEKVRRHDAFWHMIRPSAAVAVGKLSSTVVGIDRTRDLVKHNLIATPLPGSIQGIIFRHPAAYAAAASAVNAAHGQYEGQSVILQWQIQEDVRSKLEKYYQMVVTPDADHAVSWGEYVVHEDSGGRLRLLDAHEEEDQELPLPFQPVLGTELGIYGADRYVFPDLPGYYQYRVGVFSTAGRRESEIAYSGWNDPIYDHTRQRPKMLEGTTAELRDNTLELNIPIVHHRFHMPQELRALWKEAEEPFDGVADGEHKLGDLPDLHLVYQIYLLVDETKGVEIAGAVNKGSRVYVPFVRLTSPFVKEPEVGETIPIRPFGYTPEILDPDIKIINAAGNDGGFVIVQDANHLCFKIRLRLDRPSLIRTIENLGLKNGDKTNADRLIAVAVQRRGTWSKLVPDPALGLE